ncbi:MAG: hypothetical protein JWN99_3326, partial [Ilumatobacteraceae bacterium]|nr:hypothetical protein [Ilumatobacteraceae bacterium]
MTVMLTGPFVTLVDCAQIAQSVEHFTR